MCPLGGAQTTEHSLLADFMHTLQVWVMVEQSSGHTRKTGSSSTGSVMAAAAAAASGTWLSGELRALHMEPGEGAASAGSGKVSALMH